MGETSVQPSLSWAVDTCLKDTMPHLTCLLQEHKKADPGGDRRVQGGKWGQSAEVDLLTKAMLQRLNTLQICQSFAEEAMLQDLSVSQMLQSRTGSGSQAEVAYEAKKQSAVLEPESAAEPPNTSPQIEKQSQAYIP